MKKLLLMRHAKSSWKNVDIPDHDRPLKKRGSKDAARMGKKLKDKGIHPDKILCSSAERAVRTAEALLEKLGDKSEVEYSERLYMAECSTILGVLQDLPDDLKTVMVIGHNPGMEALVQLLAGKLESLPTASIAYLQVKIDHWKELNKEADIKLKKIWRPRDLK